MTAFQCAFSHCFTTNVTATAISASFIPSSPLHFFTVSAIPPCLCDTFPKFGDLFSHRDVAEQRVAGVLPAAGLTQPGIARDPAPCPLPGLMKNRQVDMTKIKSLLQKCQTSLCHGHE